MKKLLLILIAAVVSCGCHSPIIKYTEYDPSYPFVFNSWYKADDTYWFETPSEELARAEYKRITNHEADNIPCQKYGFTLWTDSYGVYYITQVKK